MNALAEAYGDRIEILGFPCNQFGEQNNVNNEELHNFLKYVRPGRGFEVARGVTLFEKTDVNGASAAPVFKWMKGALRVPAGGSEDTQGNGCADSDVLILPHDSAMNVQGKEASVALWAPVCRSDIAWNFEKFLFDGRGWPVQRYSRFTGTGALGPDLEELLR